VSLGLCESLCSQLSFFPSLEFGEFTVQVVTRNGCEDDYYATFTRNFNTCNRKTGSNNRFNGTRHIGLLEQFTHFHNENQHPNFASKWRAQKQRTVDASK